MKGRMAKINKPKMVLWRLLLHFEGGKKATGEMSDLHSLNKEKRHKLIADVFPSSDYIN